MTQKKLIVVAGPTASGKTDLAIQLAQHFKTQIISADSRQCYTELNIGVAKPSIQQLQTVQHYFIDSHSITENVNAGQYEQLALQYLNTIFSHSDYAILCGGTGLYIKALCDGIDIMPTIDTAITTQVNDGYKINGINWLQQQLQQHDPLFYAQGEIKNPARMLRALSFILSTGQSILTFHKHTKVIRNFTIVKYCIDMDRNILYHRINERVNAMMQQGLVEEVQNLVPYQHLKNLQTVGYTELFEYIQGNISLEQATQLIQQNTRHYAKRQITWFKKDTDYNFLSASDIYTAVTKKYTHCF